jgi:hypothetical protein
MKKPTTERGVVVSGWYDAVAFCENMKFVPFCLVLYSIGKLVASGRTILGFTGLPLIPTFSPRENE